MLLFLLFYYIYFLYRSMESFHMLQQNLYNENNRYLNWISKNFKRVFSIWDFMPLVFFTTLFFVEDKSIIDFALVASVMIYMYCIYIEYRKNRENQNKIPLKFTNRIKRLFITIMIIGILPAIFLIKLDNNIIFVILLLLMTLMLAFIYYVVYLAHIINIPIVKLEKHYYYNKAKTKLKNLNNLEIVGITGSYGKTSSKNVVNELLSSKYIVRPSPLNYNTLNGLMITINNKLDKFDEVFIAEMGAYVRGEIKEICDLVKPKYGILTTIGEAHLESFKSKENIQKAKFELIESLEDDGLAILNCDDQWQVNYDLKNPVKVIWIGIENKEKADFYADNIKIDNKGMSFDCIFGKEKISLQTKLLGKHNIYNILAGIALAIKLDIPHDEIKNSVSSLIPVPHRLELKKIGNFYQLDDAYNSNPSGVKSALEVLSLMDGDKCVVTPGMIELGEKEQEENYNFGKNISEVADYVILIGKKRTKDIYKGLIDSKYDKDKIFILNNVVDAYKLINSLIDNDRKMYALFENDLPDIYTEGE